MNDRFKFRIFSKTAKKFIYFDKSELSIDRENMGLLFRSEHLYLGNYEELQQCTGLKDKNGTLIYEGDIIKDKLNHIRVVVWEQDSFKYPALKTSRYFHSPIPNKLEERKVDLRSKLTFQDNVAKYEKKHFEVIGNIYKNPELLEVSE